MGHESCATPVDLLHVEHVKQTLRVPVQWPRPAKDGRPKRASEKRDRFGECPDRIPIGPGFAHVLRGVSLY